MVVGLSATSAVAATPNAVPDMEAPELVSYSVDETDFNLSRGDATFTVTARITDETGLDRTSGLFNPADPVITVSSNESDQSHGFGSMDLVSGDVTDGVYERTVTIPQGAAWGTWDVTIYPLSDELGNSSGLDDFEFFGTLDVITTRYDQEIEPVAPTFQDEDGAESDAVVIPEVEGASYTVNGEATASGTHPASGETTVAVTALDEYYFTTNATTEWTYKYDPTSQTTPAAVTFSDQSGTENDSYTVPESEGVTYFVNNEEVEAGTYPGVGIVTVEARADEGYVLDTNAVSDWVHEFNSEEMFVDSAVPSVTGQAVVGGTLTAEPGDWGPKGVELSYQWKTDGEAIEGATGSTLALTEDHLGQTITVAVTGTLAGYTTQSRESAPTAEVAWEDLFSDNQDADTWYYAPINWMVALDMTHGYVDGTFRPYQEVTRAEAVTFLYRYTKPDFEVPTESAFPDVPVGHNHFDSISWATETGVVKGYDDGTFKPRQDMTRGEVATILYRQANPDFTAPEEAPFKDIEPGGTYYEPITWMESLDITEGYSTGNFGVFDEVSRGEIAAFLYRYENAVK